MSILKSIIEFFNPPPKFQVGDVIRQNEEFPDPDMDLLIVNVGKEQYQYMFNKFQRNKYSANIRYIDTEFKKVER